VNPAGDPVFGADIMSNAGLSSLVTGVTSLEDPAVATQNRTQVIRAIQDNITQFLDQLVAKLAEPKAVLVIVETGTCKHSQPDVGKTRGVAVAVLKTESHQAANDE